MSDEPAEPIHRTNPPTWRKWINWASSALLIALLLRFAWLFRPGDARHDIEVGPDTTVITGPLTPDGFIDFTAAVNEQASAGVTPENNAVALLVQAYGPDVIPAGQRERYFDLLGVPIPPENGDYLLDDRQFLATRGIDEFTLAEHLFPLEDEEKAAQKSPWTREQFPKMAELLDANETPLAVVSASTERTRFYSPLIGSILNGPLPVEKRNRTAGNLLVQRAMLRLGEGNTDAAGADLLACHRLARLTARSPTIMGSIVGYEIEGIALAGDDELIRSRRLTADDARRYLAELNALPPFPIAADLVDGPVRLGGIQMLYGIAVGLPDVCHADGEVQSRGATQLTRTLDWNVILRVLNERVDEGVAFMRFPTAERAAALKQIDRKYDQRSFPMGALLSAVVGFREPISREFGEMMVGLLPTRAGGPSDTRMQITRLGFALVAFEREHGAYPESLDELVPGILSDVPLDPCSGDPFQYQRNADGFLLYSIGENLTDDGGAGYEDDPRGDDLVLRVNAK